MKAFPGVTPAVFDATPAVTWDWLLQIESAVNESADGPDVRGDANA